MTVCVRADIARFEVHAPRFSTGTPHLVALDPEVGAHDSRIAVMTSTPGYPGGGCGCAPVFFVGRNGERPHRQVGFEQGGCQPASLQQGMASGEVYEHVSAFARRCGQLSSYPG